MPLPSTLPTRDPIAAVQFEPPRVAVELGRIMEQLATRCTLFYHSYTN